jgi:hypothetical protein
MVVIKTQSVLGNLSTGMFNRFDAEPNIQAFVSGSEKISQQKIFTKKVN